MKNILNVLAFFLFFAFGTANAGLIEANFENGWIVNFDDQITAAYLGETRYGGSEFQNTGNDLVISDDLRRLTEVSNGLVEFLEVSAVDLNTYPLVDFNSNSLLAFPSDITYDMLISDVMDLLVRESFIWQTRAFSTGLYSAGTTRMQSWMYVDTGGGNTGGGTGNTVPEPSSLALLGLGLIGFGVTSLKKQKQKKAQA